jgi:hypothetical protein
MLSQVNSDQQLDMNVVYKDAQLLNHIACDRPVEFKLALPQDSSLRSCFSFVDSIVKTVEAAQATYHVNFGGLVNPDPFEPVIKVFRPLQSSMSTLSQEMSSAILKGTPRRNAVLIKDERVKFLLPVVPTHDDSEDDVGL